VQNYNKKMTYAKEREIFLENLENLDRYAFPDGKTAPNGRD